MTTQGKKPKKWSQKVTDEKRKIRLTEGVFTWTNPKKIAASIKRSATKSSARKGTPFQSSMSILNFYINRAGKDLNKKQKAVLEDAKDELRLLFKKKEK